MQDAAVRREAAKAVWGVVATLMTLGLFSPAGSRNIEAAAAAAGDDLTSLDNGTNEHL
jgi:hypothetical protein